MMVTKAEIETTPSSNGSSKTGLIAGIVAASSLILLTVGLGIGQVVSWESLFNFIFGSVLILPLTEAMFSVRLFHIQLPRILTCYAVHLPPRWYPPDASPQP